jgi:hypothetical protein
LLSKSVNRDTLTFDSFNLPANPITHAKEEINHHNNGKFVMDKLNWTEISEDTNYLEIPDITLIEYIGEREKNLMSILPIKSLIIRKTVMEQFNS